MTKDDLFKYFRTNREIIRLAAMMYVRFPLSLRSVEHLLYERGIDISHESVRFWCNRFGLMFAVEICEKRAERPRSGPQWRWHLDEVPAAAQEPATGRRKKLASLGMTGALANVLLI